MTWVARVLSGARGRVMPLLLGLAGALCLALGVAGFSELFDGRQGNPKFSLSDSLYASLQLFTLSMERPPENQQLPLTLQITRFIAPAVTAGAAWATVASLTRSWLDRGAARRWSGHHIVCGDGAVAHAIAVALQSDPVRGGRRRGSSHVLVVAERLGGSGVKALRSRRIAAVESTPDDPIFGAVLQGALSVTVALDDDAQTIRWAVAADRHLNQSIEITPIIVTAITTAGVSSRLRLSSGLRVVSLADQISRGVLVSVPFRPSPTSDGVAVIIGSGRGVVSLARRLGVTSASNVSQRVTVIGPEVGLGSLPLHARHVGVTTLEDMEVVGERLRVVETTEPLGSPVYIWSDDAARDLAVGLHLASQRPELSIVVVSSSLVFGINSRSPWPNLEILDSASALARGHLLASDVRELLRLGLEFEQLRHGGPSHEATEGPHALDELEVAGVTLEMVACDLLEGMDELGLQIVDDDECNLQLAPEEIRSLALRLARLVGHRDTRDVSALYPFAGLVARIPRILTFVSLGVSPKPEAAQRLRLDIGAAIAMAPAINENYVRRTGAPARLARSDATEADIDQALDYATKLAVAALTISTDRAGKVPALSDAVVEVLAEMEHRRWCRNRRERGWRYGAHRDDSSLTHPDMVPWSSLTEAARDLDRGPVRDMPEVLEAVGFRLVAISD